MFSFAELFKKYRLKSEFETLCDFGKTLAEEGRIYDDSIFTHWQNGKRIPRDRVLILTIIKIFVDRRGINSLDEANEFIASTGLGYLTENEQMILQKMLYKEANWRSGISL